VFGVGGYIIKFCGEIYIMWNVGKVLVWMIEVISLVGFEYFFWGVGEVVVDGFFDFEVMVVFVCKYGLEMGDVLWL